MRLALVVGGVFVTVGLIGFLWLLLMSSLRMEYLLAQIRDAVLDTAANRASGHRDPHRPRDPQHFSTPEEAAAAYRADAERQFEAFPTERV